MKTVFLKCFLFQFILAFNLYALFVHAQDANKSGFISIDCGFISPDPYIDGVTGIEYTSDAGFFPSSESKTILNSTNISEKQLLTVRSFPKGKRNCYTLRPSPGKGQKYLIRTRFVYGNYDSLNQPPTFDIYLGADLWDTVSAEDYQTSQVIKKEIIHILSYDYVHICLVNTGQGTPFVSVLELRPLNSTNSLYTPKSGSLALWNRWHFNSEKKIIRYPDDIYDRRWLSNTVRSTIILYSTSLNNYSKNEYLVPGAVLKTALTPDSSTTPFQFRWQTSNPKDQFYLYLHFAEVKKLEANQTREFDIYINDALWNNRVVNLSNSKVTTYHSISPNAGHTDYIIRLKETKTSTLLPIINAIEIYFGKQFSSLTTEEAEVAAIISIKSMYELLTKDWQGDPCYPKDLVWDGLTCSYDDPDLGRIISLDLSNSSLKGVIAPHIANLTLLKSLDLSNNNLSGEVPDFLSQFASLTVLNLKGNNFSGSLPVKLLEKWKIGLLQLSFDSPGNNTSTDLCQSTACKKKKKNSLLPVVAAIVGVVLLFALISFGIWMFSRRKQPVARTIDLVTQRNEGELTRKDRRFTYSEVLTITNNFQKVLGKGGFGTVYHGCVGDTQVAVKMLSPSSAQGYREFQVEVTILMSIHHKNLTSLVGYCNEGTDMGILYEFMANGNLHEHISERKSKVLGWKDRLRIALETAQGLEYLHHGCKPEIIHRDVKPSNILLNEQFQAKLADFGLSRASVEGGSHVSTVVAGTPGYLDPHYSTSNRLTEKSDVYSFGIVVLQMITGRPPIISRNKESTHIAEWVDSIVQNGDIIQILDPRFGGDYDVNSVWKAVELAMTCASKYPSKRPTMNSVVIDLKECLAIEISRNNFGSETPVQMDFLSTDTLPLAR